MRCLYKFIYDGIFKIHVLLLVRQHLPFSAGADLFLLMLLFFCVSSGTCIWILHQLQYTRFMSTCALR